MPNSNHAPATVTWPLFTIALVTRALVVPGVAMTFS